MFPILLNLAVAPGIFLLIIFYFVDREREPLKLVFGTFFAGVVAVIPVAILEIFAKSFFNPFAQTVSPYILQASYMFLVVAPVEEVLKFGAVIAVVFVSKEFNEWYDGILYAMVAALGFATLENLVYVLSRGFTVGLIRFFLSVPAHALFGGIMGFFLSGAKFSRKPFPWLLGALFFPILLHSLFNIFLISGHILIILLVIPLSIIMWTFLIVAIRKGWKLKSAPRKQIVGSKQ
ncbi:PrsW family intramembrane metalloprotease [candidate division WOR-3 bacterium]|nr:PrsW family intramembrane metalloprotease [candidate division WOR-3 bacterium]